MRAATAERALERGQTSMKEWFIRSLQSLYVHRREAGLKRIFIPATVSTNGSSIRTHSTLTAPWKKSSTSP